MRPFCCSISVARILRVSSLKLKYFKLNGICVILYVTNLKGERSDGEYRGSFLGLGLPGVEIRGLLPLSIFTLTSVSEYSLFVWSHKFTLIYATAIKCSVSIKSYQAFTSPRSTFIAEERTEKYLTCQTKMIEFTSQGKCQYSPCCWEFLKVPSISCCTADIYL